MSIFDWLVTSIPVFIVLGVGFFARTQVRSVADFMSGNRSAGRYLLAIAANELQTGAVVFVGSFEAFPSGGFANGWWGWLPGPIFAILGITGYIRYRYRQTRAMTLAQFFEIRYNKSFRLFTGVLGFLAGILNFGIIPATGARALVYFLGLPLQLDFWGLSVPTFAILMAIFLSITLFVALSGGAVTLMLVNCLEGMFSQIAFLILITTLIILVPWSQISEVLANRPPGHSLINPFDTSEVKDFNVWNVIMGTVSGVIGIMTWQNSSAYNSAAFSAHEGRMGSILAGWRGMGNGAVIALLAVCAFTYLQHPAYAQQAAQVRAEVHHLGNPQIEAEMVSPVALTHLLPTGVRGVLCAVLLMGIFGGDATHLHSWGGIFVQDCLVPRRKKPFEPHEHLLALRLSMTGVALFAFMFGICFTLKDYVFMWFGVTQTLFTGGAGAAIIGGLYWKKGTAAGAFWGLIVGSTLSIAGILGQQFCGSETQLYFLAEAGKYWHEFITQFSLGWLDLDVQEFHLRNMLAITKFPLNGVEIGFYSSLIALATYAIVSLLTVKEDFNLDRMLHRGAYASVAEAVHDSQPKRRSKVTWGKIIGFDDEYSVSDKWIAGVSFFMSVGFTVIFIVGTLWNFVAPWPLSVWSAFWNVVALGMPIFFAFVTGIWFTWGGIKDIRDFLRRLGREQVNELDDGTVVNNQNLDEAVKVKTPVE